MPRSIFKHLLLGILLIMFVTLVKNTGNAENFHSNLEQNVSSSGPYLPWQYQQWRQVSQGWNGAFSHTGMMQYAYDFDLASGQYIYAIQQGTVAATKADSNLCGGQDFANHGNYVVINHSDGKATLYLHLAHNGVGVWQGQQVSQGQWLGSSGNTGWTNCTPHLHFQRQDQGGWFQQSVPVYFQEYPGELTVGPWYQSQNQCTGYCPTSEQRSSEQVNYAIIQNNAQMINHPEYGFYVFYPNGLLVREWNHPNSPFVISFVDESVAYLGGELPEVSIVVHLKNTEESLPDWLEKNIMRSANSVTLEEFPLYLNVTNKTQSRVSGQEAMSFQHNFPVPRQVTIIENRNSVIQISYGPLDNSEMGEVYEYILRSFTFTASSPK